MTILLLLIPISLALLGLAVWAFVWAVRRGQFHKLHGVEQFEGYQRTQALMLSADPALEAGLKPAMTDTTAQISKIQKTIEDDELSDEDRQQMKVIPHQKKYRRPDHLLTLLS